MASGENAERTNASILVTRDMVSSLEGMIDLRVNLVFEVYGRYIPLDSAARQFSQ